jgi:cytochrome c biogenesis factor
MGAFLMALGGFLAVSDRRYRLALKTRAARMFGAAGHAD